jgi:hypothetical protein
MPNPSRKHVPSAPFTAYRLAACLAAAALAARAAAAPGDSWHVRRADAAGTRLRVTITPGAPLRVVLPQGETVAFAGPSADTHPGAPALSPLVRVWPGRPAFRARVRLVHAEFRDEPGTTVAPGAAPRLDYTAAGVRRVGSVRRQDPVIYGQDAFWPPELLHAREAWMGTNRLLRLTCHAAQYNPVRRILRVYTRIEAELQWVPEKTP